MKTTTKFALSLIVGLMAIVFSAFKTAQKEVVTDWYAPIQSDLDPESDAALNFTSYNSTPLADEPSCTNGDFVCAARFPDTGDQAQAFKRRD